MSVERKKQRAGRGLRIGTRERERVAEREREMYTENKYKRRVANFNLSLEVFR